MNEVPKLTDEQRAAAMNRAAEVRRERAVLKARVKAGMLPLAEAMGEECAKGMRVIQLLQSVPGVGRIRAERMMKDFGIAPNRKVGGLGCRQREHLLSLSKVCWAKIPHYPEPVDED